MLTPSPEIQAFAAGFPVFLAHAGVTVAILFAAVALYVLLTPHKEITLIREGNTAAAISLAGVLVGLAIPLAASLSFRANSPSCIRSWVAFSKSLRFKTLATNTHKHTFGESRAVTCAETRDL